MMKAVGASNPRFFRLIVGEAILVGIASWLATVLLSLPATAALDAVLDALARS